MWDRVSGVAYAALIVTAAAVHSVSAQPSAEWPLARLVSRSWVAPLRTSEPSNPVDRAFFAVATLTFQSRFAEARRALVPLSASLDPRTRVAAAIFDRMVSTAEVRAAGAGQESVLLDQDTAASRAALSQIDLMIAALVRNLPAAAQFQAMEAHRLAITLDMCMFEAPAWAAWVDTLQSADLPKVGSAPPPAAPCWQMLAGQLQQIAAAGGSLSALESHLLVQLARARAAAAGGERKEAEAALSDAIANLSRTETGDGLAGWWIELGDAAVSPGLPLTLGMNLAAERLIREQLSLGVPLSRFEKNARDLEAAEAAYARAAQASGNSDRWKTALSLRRAWLLFARNNFSRARIAYEETAAIANAHGDRFSRALALAGAAVSGAGTRALKGAFDSLEATDRATAVTLGQTIRSWAARTWHVGRDAASAISMLSLAADEFERRNLQEATVACLLDEMIVLRESGRAETVIVQADRALPLQRAIVTRVQSNTADPMRGDKIQTASQALFGILNNLRWALSEQVLEDPTSQWVRRLRSVTDETTALAASLPDGLLLQQALSQAVSATEVLRQALASGGTPACAETLSRVDLARQHAAAEGNPGQAVSLDWTAVICEPSRRERVNAALSRLNPAAAIGTAYKAKRLDQTEEGNLRWVSASTDAAFALQTAGFAGKIDLVRTWVGEFTALPPESTANPILRSAIVSARAELLKADGRLDAATDLLRGALAEAGPPSQQRLALRQQMLELEIQQRDANRALDALIALENEQSRWLLFRTGLADPANDSTELAMLDARAARGEQLSPEDRSRASVLRQRETSNGASARILTAAEMVKRLPPRTVLLVYYPGPTGITAWRADAAGLRLVPIGIRPLPVLDLKRELMNGTRDWIHPARVLFDGLVGTVGELPPDSTVLIYATGALRRLPFEILGPTEQSVLAAGHSIAYLSTLVTRERTGPTRSANRALVVGVDGPGLSHAEEEASQIAGLLATKPVSGASATRQAVLQEMGAAKLVHLAAHAWLKSDNPYLSYVELGNGDRLEAWELGRALTSAELLVLSACDTAQEARGLSPLGRNSTDVTSLTAFAFAGRVTWVVASLWAAEDFYTKEILTNFYAQLQAPGVTPASALHIAKKGFIGKIPPTQYVHMVVIVRDILGLSGS